MPRAEPGAGGRVGSTAPGGRPVAEAGPGVYIHLPFCARVCPYCDFAVAVGARPERRRLVAAVRREIELYAARQPAAARLAGIDTIYFGGGTPSLVEPEGLASLLGTLRHHLDVAPDCRVFLEANPEHVRPAAVGAWRALGVTTVSLGVQSLDAAALVFLGRAHTPAQAERAVSLAREAGFETVSLDLIYGRPGQALAAWRRELDAVARLAPDHISCYQLTVAAATPFGRLAARGELAMPPEPRQAELFLATHAALADHGFAAYEVSNFARAPRHRSRHNMKYWRGAPYVGFGPSAHSFVAPRRWWNVSDAREYVERVDSGAGPRAGEEALSPGAELLEAVMLGLRTVAGIDLGALERRFGVELRRRNRERLAAWRRGGWVVGRGGRLRPTPAGMAVADHLAAALELPAPEEPARRAAGRA